MPRRIKGDPLVPPWPGSADEQASLRARAEREREVRELVDVALACADFQAAHDAGFDPVAVRRLAERNAEFAGDLGDLADLLNRESLRPDPGREWTWSLVADCLRALWASERAASWPRRLGRYPGDPMGNRRIDCWLYWSWSASPPSGMLNVSIPCSELPPRDRVPPRGDLRHVD
ncbi:hypothetical protein [Nocardia sp.]|uniref:hypothetical protein n=1 Tax=Nocardia sp. TaxID=1821 RepID=UPI00260EECA0|nr:hypothetical protein [Nocardia sp.]